MHATIIFDTNNIEATLQPGDKIPRAEQDANRDIVLKAGNIPLFTFKFDYIWGAELIADGADTGWDIKGCWFKPGTRLTNDEDKDLVVAVKKGNGLEVSVPDEGLRPTLVVATVYYHIYASGVRCALCCRAAYCAEGSAKSLPVAGNVLN